MLRLLALPFLGFVIRPVVLALAGAAFMAGIHVERTTQERRCAAEGGAWAAGLCRGAPR
jgi:hypothetical protein